MQRYLEPQLNRVKSILNSRAGAQTLLSESLARRVLDCRSRLKQAAMRWIAVVKRAEPVRDSRVRILCRRVRPVRRAARQGRDAYVRTGKRVWHPDRMLLPPAGD
jgi:hypothetical protein